MAVLLLIINLAGISTAVSLVPAWKEPPVAGGLFFNVMFSVDGSTVYRGGNQLLYVPGMEPATGGGGPTPFPL